MDNNSPPKNINILTLNCWGIKYVTSLRTQRLAEIGRRIAEAEPTPDIVGLQECFSRDDYESIREQTRQILPYAKHYYAGPFGAGLAILSRWPFEETSMVHYSLNGLPTAFFHGDWYAGKGVACARVRYGPASDEVMDVFNTHMHASYSSDDYPCHRTGQAWEFAKLLRAAMARRHGRQLVVALGDLNTDRHELPWYIIKTLVPTLHDTWTERSPSSDLRTEEVQSRSDMENSNRRLQSDDGTTYGSPQNTWHWTRKQRSQYLKHHDENGGLAVPPDPDCSQTARIDYILASTGVQDKAMLGRDDGVWMVATAKVGMLERHPILGCSLSDHFSVETTVAFQEEIPLLLSPQQSSESQKAKSVPTSGVQNTDIPSKEQVLDRILGTLHEYELVRRRRMRWRMVRLGGAGVALFGSLVGVWVVNHVGSARFLLALAGVAATTLLIIDGLGGYLSTRTETAALEEFRWEVENDQ
ncbi:sphingomyelinase family [Fusarium sporotrichioides]|uniref:Sphingomyelinase family n=1 Tax=Fusarium sporotrichioides TaxID=5514 RepID=A0A395SCY0_FUSSP|nr:sphingomyelinase family [Fusarium sporotrichioides]